MTGSTFTRSPKNPGTCGSCGKPEGPHVWICDACSAELDVDARGLPRQLCHDGAHLACVPEVQVVDRHAPPVADTERPTPEPERPVVARPAGFAPLPAGVPTGMPHESFHRAVSEIEKAAAGVWDLIGGDEDPAARIARYVLGGKR